MNCRKHGYKDYYTLLGVSDFGPCLLVSVEQENFTRRQDNSWRSFGGVPGKRYRAYCLLANMVPLEIQIDKICNGGFTRLSRKFNMV